MIRLVQAEAEQVFTAKNCVLKQKFHKVSISMLIHPHHSEDEIHPELRFTGAGILAMANSGPNTNGASSHIMSRFSPANGYARFAILFDLGTYALLG